MPSINIYKIAEEKFDELFIHLDEAYKCLSECNEEYVVPDTDPKAYTIKLYFSEKEQPNNLKWNWVLSMFGQETRRIFGAPKGVITVYCDANCYALTFGHSFFQIDKFSDKNWAFAYAKTMKFKNIKTTALTNPHSQRNKTVNTYLRYEELEFDSGEALAKLKAKITLENGFNLFTENAEFGNSIKLSVKNPISIQKIIQIIEHIEYGVANNEIQNKIPYFRKIKDEAFITELKNQLAEDIEDNIHALDFSEYQIYATQIIFSENYEYRYEYEGYIKDIDILCIDSLSEFMTEFEIPHTEILNISVVVCEDEDEKFRTEIENLVFYTDDEKRALLMDGEWYLYNEDFLEYLSDSINEIAVLFEPIYNYSAQAHNQYIERKYEELKEKEEYQGLSMEAVKRKIKQKYYKENYFNTNLEVQSGFINFDRKLEQIDKHKFEVMDLYKDDIMYTVKFGNSSGKLCYAVDQSLEAIKAYKKRLIDFADINIKEVCIWLVLEREELPLVGGIPDVNALDMLILKNKLDLWKKEVRLLGFTPTIRINYVTD